MLTRLPSGLRVATIPMTQMASVSVGIWVGVGGRYEPSQLNGICHFIEHMLFKGTRRRTAAQISEAVEGIGGQLNAFTDEEFTCFHTRGHHSQLAALLDVLSDMLANSVFAPGEVTRERAVIREEIAMYLDQPHTLVQECLNELMWPEHPLGRPLTGTGRSLQRIKSTDMRHYMRANYTSGAIAVVVAGPVEHAQTVKLAKKLDRLLPRGARPDFPPLNGVQTRPEIRLCTKPVEQTQLALGIRACSRHSTLRYPLRLLNVILGENMSSRLFQVVREEHGLAYSIHSGVTHFDDIGALVISAGVETRTLAKSLKLILRELRRLKEQSPSRAEFNRARDYAIGQLELSLESTENHMMWTGEQVLAFNEIRPLPLVKEWIAKVNPSDVRDAARACFNPERMNLALVSPLKRATSLAGIMEA